MSSFTRRIQRTLGRDDEGKIVTRRRSFMGRGQRLGTVNPKDPCRTGKRKKPKKWRAVENAPPAKPAMRFKASAKSSREELDAAHKAKMASKDVRRGTMHVAANSTARVSSLLGTSSGINRRTEKPHEHKREIARRLRQIGRAK